MAPAPNGGDPGERRYGMNGDSTGHGRGCASAADIAPQQLASTTMRSGATLRTADRKSPTSSTARLIKTSTVLPTERIIEPVNGSMLCRASIFGSTGSAEKPRSRHRDTPAASVRTWMSCPRDASSVSSAQNGNRCPSAGDV